MSYVDLDSYCLEPCDGCERGLMTILTWDNRRLCEQCKQLEIARRGWFTDPAELKKMTERYEREEAERRTKELEALKAKAAKDERELKERELAAKLRKEHLKAKKEQKGPELFS